MFMHDVMSFGSLMNEFGVDFSRTLPLGGASPLPSGHAAKISVTGDGCDINGLTNRIIDTRLTDFESLEDFPLSPLTTCGASAGLPELGLAIPESSFALFEDDHPFSKRKALPEPRVLSMPGDCFVEREERFQVLTAGVWALYEQFQVPLKITTGSFIWDRFDCLVCSGPVSASHWCHSSSVCASCFDSSVVAVDVQDGSVNELFDELPATPVVGSDLDHEVLLAYREATRDPKAVRLAYDSVVRLASKAGYRNYFDEFGVDFSRTLPLGGASPLPSGHAAKDISERRRLSH
jgi:hypothetical protein